MVDVALVKKLRESTGAGMMDCKKALTETNDNYEAACDWLREKGIAAAAKKGGRTASEGLVGIKVEGNSAAIIELNSETDFVAKNDSFQNLANQLLDTITSNNDISDIANLQLSGASGTVSTEITNAISVIGENIQLRRSDKVTSDNGFVASYIHNSVSNTLGNIGILVAIECDNITEEAKTLGKQIGMHIAASKPVSLTQEEVPAEIIAKEKEVFSTQAKESGKPDNIIEKMVEGRIRKYYSEIVLLDQAFVMDGKAPVQEIIDNFTKENNCSFKIKQFIRYEVGEGIEKKEEDFANEVQSIVANS